MLGRCRKNSTILFCILCAKSDEYIVHNLNNALPLLEDSTGPESCLDMLLLRHCIKALCKLHGHRDHARTAKQKLYWHYMDSSSTDRIWPLHEHSLLCKYRYYLWFKKVHTLSEHLETLEIIQFKGQVTDAARIIHRHLMESEWTMAWTRASQGHSVMDIAWTQYGHP